MEELDEKQKKKTNHIQDTIKKLSRDTIGSIPNKKVELSAKDKSKSRHPKHKKRVDHND